MLEVPIPRNVQKKLDDQLKGYEQVAASYDAVYQREKSNHRYKIESIAEALFRALPPKKQGYHFLEMGAGTGVHSEYFLNRHRDQIRAFTLSDFSEPMLNQAKERLKQFPDLKYVVSPAETFESAERYDAIFMSGSLHHFSDPVLAIKNLFDHLVPSGVMAICEPNVWNPLNFVRAVSTGMDWGQFFVTRANMRKELAKAGFSIVTNRVLHWRGDSELSRKIWPYDRLESIPAVDKLAIMFLLVARK